MATSQTFITLERFEDYLDDFKSWVSSTAYNLTHKIMGLGSKYHFIAHFLNGGCGTIDSLCTTLSDLDTLEGAFSEKEIMSCVALPSLVSSEASSIDKMFYGCSLLHWCDLTYLPTSLITSAADAFTGCTSLTDLVLPGLTSGDLNLSDCPLTQESAEAILSNLSATGDGGTITFSSSTYSLIEENTDLINEVYTKGWTILEG